jgi:hypothetical protein
MAGTLSLVPGCVAVSADSAATFAVVPGAEVLPADPSYFLMPPHE